MIRTIFGERGEMFSETRNARAKRVQHSTTDVEDLRRSRANLQQLIYSMEHDRSLNAESSKITALREMLQGIEARIGTASVL